MHIRFNDAYNIHVNSCAFVHITDTSHSHAAACFTWGHFKVLKNNPKIQTTKGVMELSPAAVENSTHIANYTMISYRVNIKTLGILQRLGKLTLAVAIP